MPALPRLVPLLFAALAAWVPPAHAGLDVPAALARIQQMAEDSPRKALEQLHAVHGLADPDMSYDDRQRLLRIEVWLREDLGELDAALAVERQALQLAEAHGDTAGAALARLGGVRALLDRNRLDAAQALLDSIAAQVPPHAPTALRVAMERTQGDILNAGARFDAALAAYLRGLRLLQGLPGEGGRRAMLYARIAQVYINADNPAKAIETAGQGLAEAHMPLQTSGLLQFTRGIALIRQGRDDEGIAAFRKALAMAERAGMLGMQASIRGNIADYCLRRGDYARAERESRQALLVSTRVGDQNNILMARANLGFALMGQGRIDEGTPYVDDVIAHLRTGKLTADLEAMLDEKGRMLERAGQYQRALGIVREQQALQQSSARVARDRAIASLQETFDANRRSQQIVLLQRDNKLKDAELRNRRTVQLATTFGAVLTVLAGAIVTVMYRRTARSNARLKELNVQLEFGSTHDALTGLHNRRSLTNRMNGRTGDGREERRSGVPGAVDCFVLMDIDHFKSINDRWGHGAGDAVLVEVARRLATAVRDTDMVVRWGGEEFMIHAPGMDPEIIPGMAHRILDAVGAAPVDAGTCRIPVTLTAGIVALPPDADEAFDWQAAVRLADWALYQGKAQGRNQARIVARLHAPAAAVLAALESGDGTAAGQLPALDCVPGPRQAGAYPAQAGVHPADDGRVDAGTAPLGAGA